MTEYVGDEYGDDLGGNEGTAPGEGKNDVPATTGTHRGWGDPQAGERPADADDPDED
jgi:hypothetical protein